MIQSAKSTNHKDLSLKKVPDKEAATAPKETPQSSAQKIPKKVNEEPIRDVEYVKATLSGDLCAFEELINRYKNAIFNIAYYKSNNPFDAEDLTQDIFLAAYKALSTLKDIENFGGWLFGIAHNRCHKWFRRERTKILKFKEIGQIKAREARLALKKKPELEEEKVQISTEIQHLPHEIQRVLVLKYLEGFSYEAIEERLGIKPYRIDYLIRKGKTMLKQRLQHKEIP